MKITQEAVDLIKTFEGYRSAAYVDPVGIVTIGYGTTARAGVGITPRLGMTISEPVARQYLEAAIDKTVAAITPYIKRPINPHELGAFTSLAYNVGASAFANSTALARFNAGDKLGAAEAIEWWNKGTVGGRKVVLKGLVRRRAAERALFLKPFAAPRAPVQGNPFAALIAFLNRIFKGA